MSCISIPDLVCRACTADGTSGGTGNAFESYTNVFRTAAAAAAWPASGANGGPAKRSIPAAFLCCAVEPAAAVVSSSLVVAAAACLVLSEVLWGGFCGVQDRQEDAKSSSKCDTAKASLFVASLFIEENT